MLVDRSSKSFIARSEPLIPDFDERMLNGIFENIM
ncbi:hypothetical protein SAMN05421755_101058 [Nitrosomonas sp. Nm33]|nr:hypothetical protein SAMN05421755_101058 [Nitrosomonas sp. Nm33]